MSHTHTHEGAGPACRHGAEAPLLMDVNLHPEVMDAGVTASSGPGVERQEGAGWGHSGHWLVFCSGTLT